MANLKISQLTAGAPAQATDLLPIDRAGANYSLQVSDIGSQILTAQFPQVVFVKNVAGINAPVAFGPIYTILVTGSYRCTIEAWTTTASSSAWTVTLLTTNFPTGTAGGNAYFSISAIVGTTALNGYGSALSGPITSGTVIDFEILTASGSNTGGVLSYQLVIERLA